MKKKLFFALLASMALSAATCPVIAEEPDIAVAEPASATVTAIDDVVITDDEASTADLTVDSSEADTDLEVAAAPGAKVSKPADNDVLARFKNMRADIQKLIRQRFFDKAEKQIEELRAAVKGSKMADDRKLTFISSLERREKVTLFSAQGQYQKAADAIRQAISYHEIKGDKERLLKVQEKVGIQKEWLDTRIKLEKQLHKLLVAKQPLLKEKLAILKQMDSKRKLSDAELKKLQVALKQVNEKISKISKEQQEAHRVFAVKRDKMRKAGVILSAAQHREVFPHYMKRMLVRFENYKLHKQIARHLTNIAEDSEVSWKDLKQNFAALRKLQDKVWNLRKELAAISEKKPMSEADYQAAKKIRAELERAMDASEKLMDKVEDAFVDQKVFGKLTAAEKLEFVQLFRDVWSQDKEFDSLKPALEELYASIFDVPVIIDDPKPVDPTPLPKPEPIGANIEGSGYIIQENDAFLLLFGDKIFWPNNLPARFRSNKLEVKFAADFILRAMPMDESSRDDLKKEWWRKYPEIRFSHISAPQLPDEPVYSPIGVASPTEVIEEKLDNENRPANLMNAF